MEISSFVIHMGALLVCFYVFYLYFNAQKKVKLLSQILCAEENDFVIINVSDFFKFICRLKQIPFKSEGTSFKEEIIYLLQVRNLFFSESSSFESLCLNKKGDELLVTLEGSELKLDFIKLGKNLSYEILKVNKND